MNMQEFVHINFRRIPDLRLPTSLPRLVVVRTVKIARVLFPFLVVILILVRLNTSGTSSYEEDYDEIDPDYPFHISYPTNPSYPPLQFDQNDFYGDKKLLKYEHLFAPRKDRITPMDFKFMITAEDLCGREDEPTLLVMVMSLPSMKRQRQAIRATWGSVAVGHQWPDRNMNGSMRLLFLFGNTYNRSDQKILAQESESMADIVQADFKESYFNFTYKVLMGFRWVEKYCPGAQYIMKTDDDTFFNVPYILTLLQTMKLNNTIYGPFFYTGPVLRKGKSRVKRTAYSARVYPPHVKGNIYIMPRNLSLNIAHVAEYMPYVNIEDAYITGVLAKLFDARHLPIAKGLYNIFTPAKKCDLALEKKMISQQIYEEDFFMIWNRIIDKNMCNNETYV